MCKEEHTAKLQLEYDSVEHKRTYDIDTYVCYLSRTRTTSLAGREVCLTKGFSKNQENLLEFPTSKRNHFSTRKVIERLINNTINIVSSILHYNISLSYHESLYSMSSSIHSYFYEFYHQKVMFKIIHICDVIELRGLYTTLRSRINPWITSTYKGD